MIIIGNIISFVSCVVNICSGSVKKHTLLLQTIAIILMSVAYLLLGSFTGVLSNVLSIIRNCLSMKNVLFWWSKILLCSGFTAILVLFPDKSNLYAFLSVIPYTLLLNNNETTIKILTIVTTVPWILFNVLVNNYMGAVFSVLTIISYSVGLIRMRQNNTER